MIRGAKEHTAFTDGLITTWGSKSVGSKPVAGCTAELHRDVVHCEGAE